MSDRLIIFDPVPTDVKCSVIVNGDQLTIVPCPVTKYNLFYDKHHNIVDLRDNKIISAITYGSLTLTRSTNQSLLTTNSEINKVHAELLEHRSSDLTTPLNELRINAYKKTEWKSLIQTFRSLTIDKSISLLFQPSRPIRLAKNPLSVLATLRLLAGSHNVIIAGGAIIDLMLGLKVNDYDCFFTSTTDYINYLKWITSTFEIVNLDIFTTTVNITIKHERIRYKLQLVNRCYSSAAEVILGFDLPICAMMFYRNQIWISERAELVLTQGYMWLDPTVVSHSYGLRLAKYGYRKGIPTMVDSCSKPTDEIKTLLSINPQYLAPMVNTMGYFIYLNEYYRTCDDKIHSVSEYNNGNHFELPGSEVIVTVNGDNRPVIINNPIGDEEIPTTVKLTLVKGTNIGRDQFITTEVMESLALLRYDQYEKMISVFDK